MKDRAAHHLPAAHPAPQGLLAAPPAYPTLACSQNCSRLSRFISTVASVFW